MGEALKTIVYRGGVVTFRIPESWIEHYDDYDGGLFFEDRPDASNLRLNVISGTGPITPDTPANLLARRPGKVERLANGTALVRHVVRTEEEGVPLLITRWEIAQGIDPNQFRVVMFTWTILASQEGDGAVLAEGELLDREIRAAVLAAERGV